MPIIPIIRPAVDTPVGRVPSLFALDIAPKMSAKNEGTTVQQETRPTIPQIRDATAKPSDVFCWATSAGLTGAY